MKKFYEELIADNLMFKIFSAITILLLLTSFLMPPTGYIDGSVLAATGELFAFAALWTLIRAIDKGKTATVSHGATSLTIDDKVEQHDDTIVPNETMEL